MNFQWLVPPASLPGFILPSWTVNWADFSTRLLPHTATELACGLVPPIALLAGFATRGRALLRQIKWELGLLVVVLIIAMLPSAGVFRWSFRWLPFVHVLLALTAAEALQVLGSLERWLNRRGHKGGRETEILYACYSGVAGTCPGWIGHRGVMGLSHARRARLSVRLDYPWDWRDLGGSGKNADCAKWAAVIITFASLLATYLCLPPNCGVPKYNLAQELTSPAPLDPARLYLKRLSRARVRLPRWKTSRNLSARLCVPAAPPCGAASLCSTVTARSGPSGVAREFGFATHGEIRADVGELLLEQESGAEGILARLGVDGIIVASEMGWIPQPEGEWEMAVATEEGRVFHRRNGALARVRSVTAIDSRPNEQFASAAVSRDRERTKPASSRRNRPSKWPTRLAHHLAAVLRRISGEDWRRSIESRLIPRLDAGYRNTGRSERPVDVSLPALVADLWRRDLGCVPCFCHARRP